MSQRLLHVAFLPLAFLLLGACSSAPPQQFYQLQGSATPPTPSADGPAVLLGPLQLADYLQRESLMQRHSLQRLDISASGRWAGSLQNDIGQLLLATLASDLHSSRLALYPDRIGFPAQAQIILHISRLDSGPQQPAVLEARWRLLDARGEQRASDLLHLQQAHDGSLDGQVAAQGQLVEQLGQQLARAVRTLPAAPLDNPAAAAR
ncbi:PqiC family protein [Aquipseudomonas guryensis]|uniref:Membrane integrity-associated transporter subunit PqiC n=1 Tax=Aquipseudomonas guryensis TaxID=2759165 RepID=A0A7W4H4C9_9GAMM|nr:ABC-type transport auxiliary lipoprotein family protein [Pseudomonas guryensis]MBB1520480.1 membrane integrity-associated transporter subunit PqiC [Pseudomonas guryensis]